MLVDFQWADVTKPSGSYLVGWRWYKDGALVSETKKQVAFNSSPHTTRTTRAATSLGIGHFTVTTSLDGTVASTSEQAPVLGMTAASFAAVMLVFGFRLLLDFSPGLVVQSTGLTLNGKLGYGGAVPWIDIIGFSLARYGHDYQLIVNVRHPESYIARGSYIYRKLNSISAALFGSPIRINAGLLDYNRNDLLRVLSDLRLRCDEQNRFETS
jgi:hypothetical protein